jgi:hypothetical protein
VQKSFSMTLSSDHILRIIEYHCIQNFGLSSNYQSEAPMLFSFMQAYDLIMQNESYEFPFRFKLMMCSIFAQLFRSIPTPTMYFVPLLINMHQKKNVGLEIKSTKVWLFNLSISSYLTF